MKELEKHLDTYCELHWWNMGKKTLSFKGTLSELLKLHDVKYTCTRTDSEHSYLFKFKNPYGIKFESRGLLSDFPHLAKQFMQMELVRMGDKSKLYVEGVWRPTVTVNF